MYSPTYGEVSFQEMVSIIKAYAVQDPNLEYVIAVGTDSQNSDFTKVPVTVGIHRIINKVGKGGIYFFEIKKIKKINNIRQKIFYETNLSIELALKLNHTFAESNILHEIQVHVDVGYNGPTSQYVSEIKGWVKACGFQCVIKPDSYMASSVANRLSK